MRTRLHRENPHGHDRYGFAWEHVPAGSEAHLDFGCYRGAFLDSLRTRSIGRRVGVDVVADAVAEGRRRFPDVEFAVIEPHAPLPFPDRTFSSATLLDVIEHVADQAAVLDELNRVLRDDGVLVVTVPGRYILSALDAGNFKFRFPRLHRWYYCRNHTREEYERRYVSNPEGLIGDVSAEKRWHEHFSRQGLRALLERSGFAVVEFDGSAFFGRPLGLMQHVVGRLGPLRRLLRRAMAADARWFASMNLFCLARKTTHRQADCPL